MGIGDDKEDSREPPGNLCGITRNRVLRSGGLKGSLQQRRALAIMAITE